MNKVLVIEDDPEIVDLLEIHLKDLSCDLIKSYSGEDGLAQAKKSTRFSDPGCNATWYRWHGSLSSNQK